MDLLEIASWIVFSLALSAMVMFGISSACEKQWRAVWVSFVMIVLAIAPLAAVLAIEFPGRRMVLAAVLFIGFVALLVLMVPFGKYTAVEIVGQQSKVDERDALLHRFYRLEPGSEDFRSYYRRHPEKRAFDDKVRALPGLTQPGSKTFDPFTSSYQAALFSQVEYLNRFSDEQLQQPTIGKVHRSADEFSSRLKGFARYLGADLVGCTRLNHAYVYSHIGRSPGRFGASIDYSHHTHALVVAVRTSVDMVVHAPGSQSTTETSYRYLQTANIAMVLARFITLLGYKARAHVDGNYRVMCVPIAVDAGLGELGRLGLLVTRKFGPRVRLAVVTTDMPLVNDGPRGFGVQEFCEICAKCSVCCPSGSVDKGEKGVLRGVKKWKTQMDSCYRTWRLLGSDCGVCVKVCPYSHPDTFIHNLVRFAISRNPLARRLMLMADDLFYGRKPLKRPPSPGWHT